MNKINPIQAFLNLSKDAKNVCFLHSQNKSILAYNPVDKYSSSDGIEGFKKFAKKHKDKKLIGFISYDIAYTLHNVKQTAKNDLKLPGMYFLAFDHYVEIPNSKFQISKQEGGEARMPPFLEEEDEDHINTQEAGIFSSSAFLNRSLGTSLNFQCTMSKSEYSEKFKKIKNYIKKGDVYQLNLTHRLEAKTKIPSRTLFTKIIKTNPVDFLTYIEGDGFEILSASPERFIKIQNGKIETCPIKGTRPRGKNEKEDESLKNELIENEKEAAELNMITDLLRNDIGKVSKIASVKVEGHRLISKCPKLWHTYSKITGKITVSSIEALISMLPGGSITGCPKKRAIEIIDELEPVTRGIYTGVIGHIEPYSQDLDFSIAIRTIIKKNDKLYLQVGGGIVIDSDEESEYDETLHKAASFMNIL